MPERACRVCGCTNENCRQCIERTGHPCSWVEYDLCSACVGETTEEPMKITITKTDTILELDGVPVRLWEGKTESGIRCQVFVHRVAVDERQDCSEFARELREKEPAKDWPIPKPIELRHII